MNDKYKNIFNIVFNAILAMYPILIFYFLIVQKVPVRVFSIFIIALAILEFIFKITFKSEKNLVSIILKSLLLITIGILGFVLNSSTILKLSPVFINIILIYTFGITLFQPPSMIYRFAILADKSIPNSPAQEKIAAYCYKVTVVWIVFFILNGSIAALTVFFTSDLIWVIYNSGITNVLMGILFVGEYIVRKFVQKKIAKEIS